MGALCCCLRVEDFEDYVNPNNSLFRSCICFSCLLNAYTALFQRGTVHAIPSSIEGETSLTSTTANDNSLSEMYRSPPRPLPYDADPRCFRLQRDGLVSRREKGSSHSHEESEPLRRSDTDSSLEFHTGDKWNGSDEGRSKNCLSESSVKHPLARVSSGVGYVYSSSEDEDVCPTCLEEYTPENPKIMTQCSHHFHLVCIYEWMERSETCPVCGKLGCFCKNLQKSKGYFDECVFVTMKLLMFFCLLLLERLLSPAGDGIQRNELIALKHRIITEAVTNRKRKKKL